MDWRKFASTEWVAFLMIFGVATHALYTKFLTGNEWGIVAIGLCINLLTVRWHKKKTSLEHPEASSFDPPEMP